MHRLPEAELTQIEKLLTAGLLVEVDVMRVDHEVDEVSVVDLEVDTDASFIAEGFVVHNSKICRFMHGRVFSVERAMKRFRDVERLRDPERIQDLQPWL